MANPSALPLKVLLVEDNPNDTLLVIEELRLGGFDPQWTRVESQSALLDRLAEEDFDVVLTDYRIPGWDVVTALRAIRARDIDVPVIVVSGSIGEEQAIETLQEGAVDYVWKDRLRRLSAAVTRALDRKRAERVLKESEERYRSMFEANPVPMWVFDRETLRFLDVNDAAVEHYGYTRDEFLQMTIQDVRRPDDQSALAAALASAPSSSGRRTSGEFRHRTKDGTVIDVHVESHGMTFLGRPARVVLAADISGRKRAEREVRDSEERFRLIAGTVSDVFWIADVGLSAIVYASPAFEQVWGRSVQSLYANPRAFLDAIHPDDIAQVRKTLRKLKTGEPFEHEYRIIRPDGDVRWIWDHGYPIRDEAGRAAQYVGSAQDVTPRRRAEEALHLSEERMRLALAASRVGVWEGDLRNETTYWSDVCEEIHGLAPGTFGKTPEAFMGLIHPEDRARVTEEIDSAIRNRSQTTIEYRTPRNDGSDRLISSTAHFFYDAEGVPVRGMGIAIDITDRRSLETQLRQAQKMDAVGQLAGGVAHDFNNLLTVILGYAELLAPDLKNDPKRFADLEQIRNAAIRATHLTRQLLAFSRRQILQPAVLDLNHVVNDLAGMLKRLISEDIQIAVHPAPALGRVKADQGQLEQVIMNLVVNARDAMPQGGLLSIETANVEVDDDFFLRNGVAFQNEGRQFVMLTVSDTGTGMDQVTKNRIFEPFFTTKAKSKGTGLGLATVYGIVKQSGGFIWVYSEVGMGSTFKVYLPRTEEDLALAAAPSAQAPSFRGDEVVMLVEDEEGVRLLARAMLDRNGYTVIEARDAEDALRLAHGTHGRIDLLLTDVVMPGKSGPELFAALTPARPDLKVLYISGYTDEAIVRRGVLEAGTQFVQKPFTAAVLMEKVRETLDAEPLAP